MAASRPVAGTVDVPATLTLSLVDGVPPVDTKPISFWKQPAIWVTLALLPLVYFTVFMVLWPKNNYSLETRATVIMAVLGVLAAMLAYWLHSTFASGKKDDTLATIAKGPPTDGSKP